jgi:hypothetical protein
MAIALVSAGIAALVFSFLESTGMLKTLTPLNIGFAKSVIVAFVELIVSFGVLGLFLSISVRLFRRLISVRRKLANYEEYRRDMIHRWGKEAVSKIEADL